jgi:beta-1,4-N-acetylglucosaminyltransferase
MATVFVTVGTTSFDALIDVIDSDAFATAAARRGVERITMQIGRGKRVPAAEHEIAPDQWVYIRRGVAYDVYRYKSDIATDMRSANLVVSHAGGLLSVWQPRFVDFRHGLSAHDCMFRFTQDLDQYLNR